MKSQRISGQPPRVARLSISDAYLVDVIVDPAHGGRWIGKMLMKAVTEDGPGVGFRWILFTDDAHGLYEQFGFHRAGRSRDGQASRAPCGRLIP